MPSPNKKVPKRGPIVADELPFIVAYFASAGSQYANRPISLKWLPFSSGRLLRHFWREARAEVRKIVPDRASILLEDEFTGGHNSRNFENWPRDLRRELYALCARSGCQWWIDDHGNVLPHGIRSMATYCEDLTHLRATDESD